MRQTILEKKVSEDMGMLRAKFGLKNFSTSTVGSV